MAKNRKSGKDKAKKLVDAEVKKNALTNMAEELRWSPLNRPQDAVIPDPITIKIGKFRFKGLVVQSAAEGEAPGTKPGPKPKKKKKA